MEKLIAVFTEHALVIFGVILAIIVYSLIQAVVRLLSDYFVVKVFKKKLNGSNRNNGKVEVLLQELIDVSTANGEKLDAIAGVGGQVKEMHDIVCETDENKFPKIRVMEKKVKEMWDRVVRKVNGNG